RRAGRLGDGWLPAIQPGPDLDVAREIVAESALASGRDPDALGMEGHLYWAGDLDEALRGIEAWRAAGATHLSITTMDAGLPFPDGNLEVLGRIADALSLGS